MSRDAEISEADDALLDLLYGELEGDARAQAEAKVAADPAAVAELERLRAMRGAMRSWHEATEAEPSGGVDDLLAAARAARPADRPVAAAAASPDEDRGLWARITAWFQPLLAHPGLAAAATLVVVAGVAGTFYMRGGARMAEPTASSERAAARDERSYDTAPEGAPAATPTPVPAAVPEAAAPPPEKPTAAGEDLRPERARREADSPIIDLDREEKKKPSAPKRARASAPAAKGKAAGADAINPFDDRADQAPAPAEPVAAPPAAPPPPAPAPARKAPTTAPTESAPQGGAAESMPAPKPPLADKSTADAAALTREAQAAAARGDCVTVNKLSRRVRSLDANYHTRVFQRDPALRRCLDPKQAF